MAEPQRIVYLLIAKRLFGLRGGPAAEAAERTQGHGWGAFEHTAPAGVGAPHRASSV